ncbi:hypothetical protein [Micromonospora endolithica]|uniref:Uncharacterized protein n=1 Tax=Micromonospora endolithica TaxID=230091 RepID=A0A3A9ZAF0_9ACTN|nr:hypothetical protein [Micromonospora endolithica]RKN44296.1 hypothetical protein D7223_18690 [Micromonospora endolithica]TWJ25772.1 hypothetical protein JD76_05945 [Micromonospora endolithica]
MDHGDEYDDLVLDALECYQRAVRRVALDFARRGAVVRPLGVDLGALDILVVRYAQPGPVREGALGALRPTRDPEEAVVELADTLQEKEFDEGDTTWPGCVAGHAHPPTAAVVDGVASWQCPRDRTALAPIGLPPEPGPGT